MLVSVLSAVALASVVSAAPSYELRPEGVIAVGESGEFPVAVTCTPLAVASSNERLYVACGDDGVAVFDLVDPLAPMLLETREVGGRAVGLHMSTGRLWVEIERLEARVLSGALGSSRVVADPPLEAPLRTGGAQATAVGGVQAPASAPASVSTSATTGQVVTTQNDAVIVNLGAQLGVEVGSHIDLFEEFEVQLAAGEAATKERNDLAVGVVVSVSEGHARVRLGVNERVRVGALARRTNKAVTASKFFPPRAADQWSVSFTLRPFLALGSFGIGTVSDASVGYRMGNRLHIQAVFEPLGLGLADEGNVLATAGNLVVSYDEQLFEVGLGAGWSAVNNDLSPSTEAYATNDRGTGAEAITPQFDNVQAGLSIAQLARLGAQDGFHLTVRNTFILYDDEFHYGGTVGEIVVPAGKKSWVLARGGGGVAGFGFGELGLKLLLHGNGFHDSFFVAASLGGAGLFGEAKAPKRKCDSVFSGYHLDEDDKCFKSVSYGGPMVGIGLEWRP